MATSSILSKRFFFLLTAAVCLTENKSHSMEDFFGDFSDNLSYDFYDVSLNNDPHEGKKEKSKKKDKNNDKQKFQNKIEDSTFEYYDKIGSDKNPWFDKKFCEEYLDAFYNINLIEISEAKEKYWQENSNEDYPLELIFQKILFSEAQKTTSFIDKTFLKKISTQHETIQLWKKEKNWKVQSSLMLDNVLKKIEGDYIIYSEVKQRLTDLLKEKLQKTDPEYPQSQDFFPSKDLMEGSFDEDPWSTGFFPSKVLFRDSFFEEEREESHSKENKRSRGPLFVSENLERSDCKQTKISQSEDLEENKFNDESFEQSDNNNKSIKNTQTKKDKFLSYLNSGNDFSLNSGNDFSLNSGNDFSLNLDNDFSLNLDNDFSSFCMPDTAQDMMSGDDCSERIFLPRSSYEIYSSNIEEKDEIVEYTPHDSKEALSFRVISTSGAKNNCLFFSILKSRPTLLNEVMQDQEVDEDFDNVRKKVFSDIFQAMRDKKTFPAVQEEETLEPGAAITFEKYVRDTFFPEFEVSYFNFLKNKNLRDDTESLIQYLTTKYVDTSCFIDVQFGVAMSLLYGFHLTCLTPRDGFGTKSPLTSNYIYGGAGNPFLAPKNLKVKDPIYIYNKVNIHYEELESYNAN